MKFPFGLKLGLAISLLSVGVASTSVYWLYYETQSSLLKNMAEELKAKGVKSVASFTKQDIESIKKLNDQYKVLGIPLRPEILNSQPSAVFRGLGSQAIEKKILQSQAYQNIGRKLGDITNESRRDNDSDIFIMHTYLVNTVPRSPDRKVLRIIADDEDFRLSLARVRNDSWIGEYYLSASRSLSEAFDGQAIADNEFHNSAWGTVLFAAVPVKDESSKVIAVLGLNVDVRSIAKQLEQLKTTYVYIISVSLVLSLGVAFLLARWLGQPIAKLRQGAERVRNREFDTVINVKSNDELQLLAETFNSMVAEIGSYAHTLEDQIRERTTQLAEANQELETDIEKGQKLQRDFLPEPLLTLPNWEITAVFEPAKKVAGDFYDVFTLPGDYVGLVIADVCDKGVGAAMFMGLFRSLIRIFSGQIALQGFFIGSKDEAVNCLINSQIDNRSHQSDALGAVEITNNYIVKEHGETGMFATMFFGVLDPKTGLLSYINGGHESLYVLGSTGVREILVSTGPVVGMIPDMQFKISQIQLQPGDILVGYTDGITDARAPSGEFFSNKRLLSLLNQPAASASELLARIKAEVFTHIDCAPQFDDITMLAVQWSTAKGFECSIASAIEQN
jgi:serine phosphatase RsbU (regulator of sigma subunit)